MANLGGCLSLVMMMTAALLCFAFPTLAFGPIKLGTWGYDQYPSFDHSGYDGIKSINISWGEVIDGMQFTYVKNGKIIETPRIADKGPKAKEIILDYPHEYLSHIEGSVGPRSYARSAIWGLRFYTNKHVYGPFGWHITNSPTFSSFTCGKKIVGFFGDTLEQKYPSSIGVYLDSI